MEAKYDGQSLLEANFSGLVYTLCVPMLVGRCQQVSCLLCFNYTAPGVRAILFPSLKRFQRHGNIIPMLFDSCRYKIHNLEWLELHIAPKSGNLLLLCCAWFNP